MVVTDPNPNPNDELLLSLLQMSARGLERIGDVFSSIGMTQQIYYGMKFNGGDGMAAS